MCGLHARILSFQIIKRARQNYLLDQYKAKQPQAAQVLQDVLSARGVRRNARWGLGHHNNELLCRYRCSDWQRGSEEKINSCATVSLL